MRSSRTISLFSERPEPIQKPASFVVSIVAHCAAVSLLSFGILYTPEINDRIVTKHYSVRHLDLHTPEDKVHESASRGAHYPGPRAAVNKPSPGPRPVSHPAVMRETANADKGPQTLVQPDISEPIKLAEEAPVPAVTIWTPQQQVVKLVVAPLPEPATASDVKPSVNSPNQELELANLGVSATDTPTLKEAVAPATTSPLEVPGPDKVQLAPVTTTQTKAQPTPTAVMSISDLRMPDGTATLPPVNQTVTQNESGIIAPGQASTGTRLNRPGGKGKEDSAGESGEPKSVAGDRSGSMPGKGAGSGADDGPTQRFVLPRNGQFGAVVVGASLEEKFPEMSGIWNDRIAYTVYLHVGLAKSWILQYSLPRAVEATENGDVARLEAPWPFNIVRPNISADAINSDALLVHGFVNQSGKFESLGIAFPPEFQQRQFVLDALNQWQFRPAAQNGQTQKVEVLLIIPEERQE